jgi:sortase A
VTLVRAPSPGAPGETSPGGGQSRASRPARSRVAAWYVVSRTFLILGAVLVGLATWLGAGSRLYYDRAQRDDFVSFRAELAQASASAGPTKQGYPDKLLTLGIPVAVLTISQIGLHAVVLEGTSSEVLEGGPGHLRDTPLPGQRGTSVIMGRQAAYGGPFSRISNLNPGTIFTVTTTEGVSHYRVLDVRRPGDPAPPLPAGAGRLILVTADGYPFVPTGVLDVDANLMSAPKAAAMLAASEVSASERALGVDTAARVPMVLWGEALVLAGVGLSWLGSRWGRWQTRIVAVPVLVYLGVAVAGQVVRLLPNLM